MNNTAKKSLNHIQKTLNSINNHNVWRALDDTIPRDKEITNDQRLLILKSYEDAMRVELSKVDEAQSWLKAVIDDMP